MNNLWDSTAAAACATALDECVYGSRLLGGDPDLVLHGGGNTSVKAPWIDVTGRQIEALWVKGSGWDLATIEARGFTPLPLDRLLELARLDNLCDPDMVAALAAAKLDPAAPQPSIETLLHARLPHRAVQHSHADAIISLTNLRDGTQRVRDLYGDRVIVVPYVMPGFDLAKAVGELWEHQAHAATVGMVLLNHGLFTFGDTTRQAYETHHRLIEMAEQALGIESEGSPDVPVTPARPMPDPVEIARIRRDVSRHAGRPLIMRRDASHEVYRFVGRADLEAATQQGPLTPDHVIHTKPWPLIGRDVDDYAVRYGAYFDANRGRFDDDLRMLDPAPRVVLDAELGMLTAGTDVSRAGIVADIYRHSMRVIARAQDRLGGYVALPAGALFDIEYWDLEQAKLRRRAELPEMAGRVALVTGAASGIGRGCASEFLRRGAAVVGLDLSAGVSEAFDSEAWLGLETDVTDRAAVGRAISTAIDHFGGIDMVVLSAGVFGPSQPIADIDPAEWSRVMAVNLDANAAAMAAVHPYLALAPGGGSVVVIASKNVPAPGPGAAAYSASKAALTQLARVAALEWAAERIRVNCVHPDAVFDTALWSDAVLSERAARYGLTVDRYKRRNLLSVEITSATVGRVVAELCGETFRATTGAQIPVDGGNERVI